MKYRRDFSIGGLLRAACLLSAAFAYSTATLADDWDDDGDDHWYGDVNFVVGSAYTAFGQTGDPVSFVFQRRYTVVETWQGVAGHIYVDYREESGGQLFETSYVIAANCLDTNSDTGEAWIGGEVVEVTTNFGIPEIGWTIVNYVDDNDGGNPWNPDEHGSAWLIPETCKDRPEPFFLDFSQRGKIIVRGDHDNDDYDDDYDDDDESDDDD